MSVLIPHSNRDVEEFFTNSEPVEFNEDPASQPSHDPVNHPSHYTYGIEYEKLISVINYIDESIRSAAHEAVDEFLKKNGVNDNNER